MCWVKRKVANYYSAWRQQCLPYKCRWNFSQKALAWFPSSIWWKEGGSNTGRNASPSHSKCRQITSAQRKLLVLFVALVLTWESGSDEAQQPHIWPLLLPLNPGSELALKESTRGIGHIVKWRQRTQRTKTSEEIWEVWARGRWKPSGIIGRPRADNWRDVVGTFLDGSGSN